MTDLAKQIELIRNEDWDYLVILDACRYDYFKKNYENYLEGDLEKVISAGHRTDIWLKCVFRENRQDIIYVSGNPQSHYLEDHFYHMINVWNFGWDEEKGTTPPEEVRKATLLARAKHPGKKLIVHFIQPHKPYLSIGRYPGVFSEVGGQENGKDKSDRGWSIISQLVRKLPEQILGRMRVQFGIRNISRFRSELETVASKYGESGLQRLYERNLNLVLMETQKVVEGLPGRGIVTSDHGEHLGENGIYGHPSGHDCSILREVLWLRVE